MDEPDRITRLITDPRVLDRVMRESHRRAIRAHAAAGVPLVSWRDGKVVLVDPNTVTVEEPEDEDEAPDPRDPPAG